MSGKDASDVPNGSLTGREREVARLRATGLTVREIARDLFISEQTVRTHLRAIHSKLEVSNGMQLAVLVAQKPDLLSIKALQSGKIPCSGDVETEDGSVE